MNKDNECHLYDDIINLPHHRSFSHPHMSSHDRAAQFSPFAALTGHDAAISETARLTSERIELTEDGKQLLNLKLQDVSDCAGSGECFKFTYFVPDERKSGGAYIDSVGEIKKIDTYSAVVVLKDNTEIPIEEIINIARL